MIYVFLADGFEEVEAITPIDYLKRAGKTVITVGVTSQTAVGAHGIPVVCDITTKDVVLSDALEGIILPGGMPGTLNLEKDETVNRAIDFCSENGKVLAAICAAPSIFGHKNLLQNKRAICFPGFEKDLYGACIADCFAVTDGTVITAKGAGAASEFAFELISYFCGRAAADEIKATVQCCY